MSEALKDLGLGIEAKRPDSVISWEVAFGELTLNVALSSLVDFVEFLKTDSTCRFSTLVDITAVDYPEREARFEVVYHFLSMYQNQRIRLKLSVHEDDVVPSMCSRMRSNTDQVAKHFSASSTFTPACSRTWSMTRRLRSRADSSIR